MRNCSRSRGSLRVPIRVELNSINIRPASHSSRKSKTHAKTGPFPPRLGYRQGGPTPLPIDSQSERIADTESCEAPQSLKAAGTLLILAFSEAMARHDHTASKRCLKLSSPFPMRGPVELGHSQRKWLSMSMLRVLRFPGSIHGRVRPVEYPASHSVLFL